MKTAIYIEDGITQLVITPESEFEKNALSSFEDKPLKAVIFSGSFYDCRGGWIRQTYHSSHVSLGSPYENNDDKSLILRVDTNESEESS